MNKILIILLLLSIPLFAQQYEKQWDKVIGFEKEGKIKSADEIVSKINKKAISHKNEVQTIKTFFYKSKYLQTLEENAQSKIITNLRTEIARASTPSKAILNFIYGKCLNDFYKQNQYSRRAITTTNNPEENFLTWSNSQFEKQIDLAYSKSIANETSLKKIPLKTYEILFDFPPTEPNDQSSLFTYLLKENIVFVKEKIRSWEIDAKKFKDTKAALLGNSDEFIQLNLNFIENTSNIKKILYYYQKLEIDSPTFENQMERIKFCSDYILKSDEDLLNAYISLEKKLKEENQIQKIQFEKAVLYAKNASKEIHPNYNIKAIALLDSIIATKNHSNLYKQAYLKKHDLNLKTISVQLEKYIYPNESTRAFVSYKNANKLSISFYKISNSIITQFPYLASKKDSVVSEIVNSRKPIQTKNNELVDKKDYFEYSTEVLLPQLKIGSYLVLFETDSDAKNLKAFGYEIITVSNLSMLANSKDNTEYYTVIDRKNGMPVENVSLNSTHFTLKTDKDGVAFYKPEESKGNYYNQYPIELTKGNDTIQIYKSYLQNSSEYSKHIQIADFKGKVEFYLDRAIYRPGQMVYYKGIAFQKKNILSSIVPNLLVKIVIKDASNNIFKEFEVTTNEFGSFSGEIVLPKSGLTGNFRMEAEVPDDSKKDLLYNKEEEEHPFWDNVDFQNSTIDFKVEEYKRQKFEIVINPLTESYTVNQKITVIGNANSFSGATISDAKVTYTIKQETYNSRPNGRYENNDGKTQIISQSETKTDNKGKFNVDFIAKPDKNAKQENLPVFSYRIRVSVTDINGETRSTEQLVTNVGYHNLKLKVEIPNRIETKNKNSLKLESTNLNNTFVATEGEIKIYLIRKSDNKFKPRVWRKPEIEGVSDADFERLFPFEQLFPIEINERKISDKDLGGLVYSMKVNTEKDKEIQLDFMTNYPSGMYKVVFSATDKLNNLIESSADFNLIQSKEILNPSKLFTVEQMNLDPKKDGFVKIKIRSLIPTLYVNVSANYKNWMIFERNTTLKNNEAIVTIPIKKEFENKISINFTSVFENADFSDKIDVLLKKEEPKLEFDIATFRNKIEPGKLENWSFKLKASKTKLESEVLASMYDKSLDQFAKRDWGTLDFYESNYYPSTKISILGFEKTYTNINNLNTYIKPVQFENEATKLMWFGFNFNEANSAFTLREYQKQLGNKAKKPLSAKMISGIISSKTDVIPGVIVSIKGTDRKTTSDFDGYYQIEAAEGETLIFSYIGFDTKEQKIKGKEIDVQLQESQNTLDEIVVVGYQTQTKMKNIGSEKMKSIETGPAAVVEEDNTVYNTAGITMALEGKASGLSISDNSIMIRGVNSISNDKLPLYIIDGKIVSAEDFKAINVADILSIDILKDDKATSLYGSKAANGVVLITTKKGLAALTQVKARTNLSETAFFYPNLKTDARGNVSFNFTSPEALTAWKLRLFAHNKDAVTGYLEKSVITQKELMVTPNFPRFFREKDTITITTKITNMTPKAKVGMAVLQLFDATTMQAIDTKMLNMKTTKNFSIGAFGNTTASWKIFIPEGGQGVQYRILAKAGNFSDGEENVIPVLTNSTLVTESIPIWVRDHSKKEYTFENLKYNNSTTLRNHQFTLEYTSNPSWMAIQSLPYLMEFEHECAEQTFARFYANALAGEIINSNPKIASLFETWRKNGKLNSKLEENEELKSILLAETPWVNDAKTEDEQKQHLATLFDLEKMKNAQEATFNKLEQKQKPSGGFAWFDGSNENEYITRHILAGFGHLEKLTKDKSIEEKINKISKTGIPYLDRKFLENHKQRNQNLKKEEKLAWLNPNSDLHYLYTRSFYLATYPLSDSLKKVSQKYLDKVKEDWLSYTLYEKGLAALSLNRYGETTAAKKIIESLKETASNNEDWGMYWIANKAGWYWYQAPIETQALLIEAFAEIGNDTKSVDAMKVWLLKNKQTKNWPTTKATTEAVYALLLQGTDWLSVKDNTFFKIGDEKILSKKLTANEKEAETGYLKINWKADEIKREMATITIENKSKVPGYGGIYWQYFEDLDKIKNNNDVSLFVSKELYLKKSTVKGDQLQKITSQNSLKIGDLVTVRLIISAKENMEFVHLKDMRASCFEPVDVLSGYEYKAGLGFYKSTKDVATHFFFDTINKGTYVLEYDIRVNNSGDFSNGISTIESMYAPEFSSHTKGIRVNVAK